jgi:hypothetical protein
MANEHVYVYGITRAGTAPPRGTGVLDSRLTTIDCGPVAAIASPLASDAVRAKRRDLLRHSEVLQQVFAEGVVLPLRFGTLFPGPQALAEDFLAPHRDDLVSLLNRFDGVGEMRLRVSYNEQAAIFGEIIQSNPGIARLRDRARSSNAHAAQLELGEAVAAAYTRRRGADADAIVERLAAHATDVHVDEPEYELEVLRASFLVPRENVGEFDSVLESVALVHRHQMSFNCTGPVPPHSFVDLEAR